MKRADKLCSSGAASDWLNVSDAWQWLANRVFSSTPRNWQIDIPFWLHNSPKLETETSHRMRSGEQRQDELKLNAKTLPLPPLLKNNQSTWVFIPQRFNIIDTCKSFATFGSHWMLIGYILKIIRKKKNRDLLKIYRRSSEEQSNI